MPFYSRQSITLFLPPSLPPSLLPVGLVLPWLLQAQVAQPADARVSKHVVWFLRACSCSVILFLSLTLACFVAWPCLFFPSSSPPHLSFLIPACIPTLLLLPPLPFLLFPPPPLSFQCAEALRHAAHEHGPGLWRRRLHLTPPRHQPPVRRSGRSKGRGGAREGGGGGEKEEEG
jgi:hypothetical protein